LNVVPISHDVRRTITIDLDVNGPRATYRRPNLIQHSISVVMLPEWAPMPHLRHQKTLERLPVSVLESGVIGLDRRSMVHRSSLFVRMIRRNGLLPI